MMLNMSDPLVSGVQKSMFVTVYGLYRNKGCVILSQTHHEDDGWLQCPGQLKHGAQSFLTVTTPA